MSTSTTEQIINARDMVEVLRGATHRCRTAILTATAEQFARIEAYGVPLRLDVVDHVQLILNGLPDDTQFVHVTSDTIERDLYSIATSPQYAGAMVYNLDIALAKLGVEQRGHFWRNMRERFPHHKPLVMVLPETAVTLLIDENELAYWRQSGRMASISSMEEAV